MKPLGRLARITSIFGLALVGLLLLVSTATARDYEAVIAEAQSRAATASVEVGELKAAVAPMQSRLTAARKRAAPREHAAHAASVALVATKKELHGRQAKAVEGIADIKAERKGASEKKDEKVALDIGLALAALITAAIALAWGWFRASAIVAALTRVPLAKAAGATVGIGVIALLVGAGLNQAGGVVGVIGGLIFGLSLSLPVCLLLARHSAEVQRGRSKPLLRRVRLSRTVTRVIAGSFVVLFLVALIAATTKQEQHSHSVSQQLRSQAALVSSSAPKVQVERKQAAVLREQLLPLQKTVERQRSDLQGAQRKLHHAEARLVDARSDERRWSHALEAVEAEEQRELEKEELRAQRQAEKEEREYARVVEREEREAQKLAEEQEEAEACDPNYVGACLQEGIGDYDCAGGSGNGPNYVSGPIEVVGVDEFGLDSDGDGIACEDG